MVTISNTKQDTSRDETYSGEEETYDQLLTRLEEEFKQLEEDTEGFEADLDDDFYEAYENFQNTLLRFLEENH